MASILVVDDNPEFLNLLALALSRGNHVVTQARNGEDAIRMAHHLAFDLIVSDVVMPERDGIEVLVQLRATNPQLPIIIMSGDSPGHADLYLKIARHLGATTVLKKPFKIEALESAIAAARP